MYNCSYCGRIYEKTINNIRRKNVNNKFIQFAVILDNELVSLMTFGSLRKSLGQKTDKNVYELLRFCNKIGYSVIG